MLAEWRIIDDEPADPPTMTVVIRLRGDLDISVRPLLAEHLGTLATRGIGRLEFDLSDVRFMDCGVASLLLTAARAILPPGRQPVIFGASPVVERLLVLSGLDADCILQTTPMHRARRLGKPVRTVVVAPAAARTKQ